MTDVAFTFPLGGPATKLTVGKTKETFSYEMVGDAGNLPQQERVLNPFFVSRNIGVKLTQVVGESQRMTASAGVFNDWWVTGDSLADSGTDISARITGLAWDQRDGRSFLHLGASGRYAGADENILRYKGRPESNVADPAGQRRPGRRSRLASRAGGPLERRALFPAGGVQSSLGGFRREPTRNSPVTTSPGAGFSPGRRARTIAR